MALLPPLVICMGFAYWDRLQDALPGTVIDLYRMVRFVKQVMQTPRIVVVSDMTVEDAVENLRHSVLEGDIQMDIFDFMTHMRTGGHFVEWTPQLDVLRWIAAPEERAILFYFSGHGAHGAFRFPDGSFVSLSALPNAVHPGTELMIISDCCQASGLALPFEIKDGHWHRTAYSILPGKQVLALTSSLSTTLSTTSVRGSTFTRLVCLALERHYSIHDTLRLVRTHGDMVCAASAPNALDFFSWLRPTCQVRKDEWGGFVIDREREPAH